jgi:hypothetical protein
MLYASIHGGVNGPARTNFTKVMVGFLLYFKVMAILASHYDGYSQ